MIYPLDKLGVYSNTQKSARTQQESMRRLEFFRVPAYLFQSSTYYPRTHQTQSCTKYLQIGEEIVSVLAHRNMGVSSVLFKLQRYKSRNPFGLE